MSHWWNCRQKPDAQSEGAYNQCLGLLAAPARQLLTPPHLQSPQLTRNASIREGAVGSTSLCNEQFVSLEHGRSTWKVFAASSSLWSNTCRTTNIISFSYQLPISPSCIVVRGQKLMVRIKSNLPVRILLDPIVAPQDFQLRPAQNASTRHPDESSSPTSNGRFAVVMR